MLFNCFRLCFFIGNVYCQDTLYLKSGSTIACKIYSVNESDIGYRRWENPDGPLYYIGKRHVSLIKFQNGFINDFSQWGLNPTFESGISHKRNVIKLELLSIIGHKTTVGYEHNFGKQWNLESQISLISNKILPNNNLHNYNHLKIQGIGSRLSAKFELNRSPKPLSGNFIRFDLSYNRFIAFNIYRNSPYVIYAFHTTDIGNLNINLAGSGISFGGQYLLGQHFSLEYSLGLSYALYRSRFKITEPNTYPSKDESYFYNEEELYNNVLFTSPNILKSYRFPIGLTGNLAVGYVFGKRKPKPIQPSIP
jgi:hypothetical protein